MVEPPKIPFSLQCTDYFEDYINESDDEVVGNSASSFLESNDPDQFLLDCISREWTDYSNERKLDMRQPDGKSLIHLFGGEVYDSKNIRILAHLLVRY